MSLTTILAIYAAIVSSIGVGWNLYRELHDRPRVKISVSLKRLATGTDGRQFIVAPDLLIESVSAAVHVVVKLTSVADPCCCRDGAANGLFCRGNQV